MAARRRRRGAGKDGDGGASRRADGCEVWVDPRAEWRQMYHEVWRIERDFLYDPHAHGLDLAAAEKLYARYLDGHRGPRGPERPPRARRSRTSCSVTSGRSAATYPKQDHVNVGLLGADYRIEQGRYRFARILTGENWNPKLKAPLTQPGVDVKEGDYLLAVNGEELRGDDDVYRLFLGRAGKQTVITVGPRPNMNGSRQVTVVPGRARRASLRLRTGWRTTARRSTSCRAGASATCTSRTRRRRPTRTSTATTSRRSARTRCVIDERFNHGGQIADYIVEHPEAARRSWARRRARART